MVRGEETSKDRARQDAPSPEVNFGALKGYIGFQLRRAQEASSQKFAQRAGDAALNPGLFAILTLIRENPGLNQTALSIGAGRDKSTLTPALKDLEKYGFIRRQRSKMDRRAYALYLTEAGEARLEELTRHAEAHETELDALVGEVHKPLFIYLLDKIVAGLERG